VDGLKPKDLIGTPWRVALALQAAGWYLRQDIIWHKPNPMPESTADRCTKAHEYLFLLSKSARYYYDAEAIAEPAASAFDPSNAKAPDGWATHTGGHGTIHRDGREKGRSGNVARKARPDAPDTHGGSQAGSVPWEGVTRNRRSVWTVPTQPYSGAHFATFPPALIEPCILAGSRPGDTVFDPFLGSGTTGQVAQHLGRQWTGCEINPEYVELQRQRTAQPALVFA
jgi:site-specific DNA-methyltransferase (cytosine-N4-specific)